MNIDTTIFFFLNGFAGRNTIADHTIIFFAEYLPYILVIVFLVYLLCSSYSHKMKMVAGISAFLAGLIARFIFGSAIRFAWHRPRPFVSYHVHQLISESSYSFPSGHALFFFAFSTIIYIYNRKIGMAFFAASILVTVGRVMAGIHYPSDILGGALIGILSGWLVHIYITPFLERIFEVTIFDKKFK